jgi:hypothetical protein
VAFEEFLLIRQTFMDAFYNHESMAQISQHVLDVRNLTADLHNIFPGMDSVAGLSDLETARIITEHIRAMDEGMQIEEAIRASVHVVDIGVALGPIPVDFEALLARLAQSQGG